LQPLETLQVQEKTNLALNEIALDDRLDRDNKPGIYRQLQALLSTNPAATALPTIAAHATAVRGWFLPVLAQQPTSPARLIGRH